LPCSHELHQAVAHDGLVMDSRPEHVSCVCRTPPARSRFPYGTRRSHRAKSARQCDNPGADARSIEIHAPALRHRPFEAAFSSLPHFDLVAETRHASGASPIASQGCAATSTRQHRGNACQRSNKEPAPSIRMKSRTGFLLISMIHPSNMHSLLRGGRPLPRGADHGASVRWDV